MTRILLATPDAVDEVIAVFDQHIPVALPTETVYGLAAPFYDERAINAIYEVKQRPAQNPLIVHIASFDDLEHLVTIVPPTARKLARKYWPGPLTLILPAAPTNNVALAGLNTIAIRMPQSNFFLDVIKNIGPICAPSANISGKPSPTNAQDCLEDLEGKIPLIIDGGETQHGIESTVVDCTCNTPVILRQGAITQEELQLKLSEQNKQRSPGTRYRHYSPQAKVLMLTSSEMERRIPSAVNFEISSRDVAQRQFNSAMHLAKNLYKWFREADREGATNIILEIIKEEGIGAAVMERARKASSQTQKTSYLTSKKT